MSGDWVILFHRMRVEGLRAEIEKGWWQPLLKLLQVMMLLLLLLLLNLLQDTFGIVPKAVLPTKEKEALKKAFGGFNVGFEQVSVLLIIIVATAATTTIIHTIVIITGSIISISVVLNIIRCRIFIIVVKP